MRDGGDALGSGTGGGRVVDDGLGVRGGSGGVDAHLDDLLAAGALLRRCAGEVAGITAELGRRVADPMVQVSGLTAPVTLAVVDGRVASAVAGPGGLLAVVARLEALEVALRLVVAAYRDADAAVAGAVHTAELAAGAAVARLAVPVAAGLVITGGVVLVAGRRGDRRADANAGQGAGRGTGQGAGRGTGQGAGRGTGQGAGRGTGQGAGRGTGQWLLDLMAGHGALTEHAVAAVPGFLDGLVTPWPLLGAGTGPVLVGPLRDVPDAAAAAGRLGVLVPGLREPARIETRLRQGREVRPPRDLADLTARVASCYPAGPAATGSATVRVDQVIGPGGRRAWVVAIPGQQQMSLRGGSNPFDLAGDVHAMARHDTAARQSVLAAMRATGIPPGEPVLLAGHSQGGMVAAGLAADPAVRARFRVTHVLTVGAPIGEFRVPDGVQVLAVEHTDDAVPRLDGRANPDRSGWVTVRRTLHAPGVAADAVAAHDLDGYRRTMALADRSTDPSIRAYRSGLAMFLEAPGARGWSNEVSARRVPLETAAQGAG